MAQAKVADVVENLVAPVLEEMKMELVDVQYVKEGGNWYLRLFIDKDGGIDLNDCQAVSRRVDELLELADPIPQSYLLEVSSPGVERPLKKPADFKRFTGRSVNIKTFVPLNGQKSFTGHIVEAGNDSVVLNLEGSAITIPLERVASARLAVEF